MIDTIDVKSIDNGEIQCVAKPASLQLTKFDEFPLESLRGLLPFVFCKLCQSRQLCRNGMANQKGDRCERTVDI